METVINRLDFLCNSIPPLLRQLSEGEFATKPAGNKWSKKEILGHLIDSATNNHHRLVRGQFEYRPRIAYDNHVWNKGNHYMEMKALQLISFWEVYNRHFVELIRYIPEEKLANEVETGEAGKNNIVTLAFIIEDYVAHLEHHLRQLWE